MAARKKAAAKQAETKATEAAEPKAAEDLGPEPYVALPNVYRTDLGESLPPQKHPGVE